MTAQNTSNQPNRSTVLKLLSGPQQGAEARLEDGTYLIGSDDECDIVLLEESVAPRHLLLTLQQGQRGIEVRERPATVGDRNLAPGQRADLPAGTIVRLGAVRMGIGPEGTDWTKIDLPDVAERRPDETGKNRNAASEAKSGEPPQPPAAFPEQKPDLVASQPVRSAESWRRARRGLGWLGVVLATGLMVVFHPDFITWLGTGASSTPAAPGESAVEKVRTLVIKLGLEDIGIETRPDGTVVLTGYCDTPATKNRLTAALLVQGVRADNRIWPEDSLREAVAETLDRLGGKRLSHDYLGKGAIRLQGYLRVDLPHDQLLSILRNDVPGISRIESNVKTLADFATALKDRVRQADIEEQVTISTEGAGITASGVLDTERMERWKSVARAFVAETRGFPPLEERVKPLAARRMEPRTAPSSTTGGVESPTVPRISVRGVVIRPDQPAFALLGDGTRVAEGDPVDDRHVVEKIQFDRIIVRGGPRKSVYYVGDFVHE